MPKTTAKKKAPNDRKDVFVVVGVILGILVVGFIGLYCSAYWSVQDVYVEAPSELNPIQIDGRQVGYGRVCIPSVRRGPHTITIQGTDTTIFQGYYFVSDDILEEKQMQIPHEGVLVGAANCAVWTFNGGQEPPIITQ